MKQEIAKRSPFLLFKVPDRVQLLSGLRFAIKLIPLLFPP